VRKVLGDMLLLRDVLYRTMRDQRNTGEHIEMSLLAEVNAPLTQTDSTSFGLEGRRR
jgi:hypothetical protein